MHHSYLDKYSYIKSPIHRLDARVKTITFLIFILFIIFTAPDYYLSFLIYGLILSILITLSKIPLRFVVTKTLVLVPFVLMIAVFIPFFKQGEILAEFSFYGMKAEITGAGLIMFWAVIIKAYLSMLCVILLISTTVFTSFLKALEKLYMPKVFIMIMSFMYRYIFIILDELMKMNQAKLARGAKNRGWFNVKVLSNMLGVLFVRAYEKGENVYLAMNARGFQGDIRTLEQFRITKFDIMFLIIIISCLSGIKIFAE
ncbi:Cobalt ABC transporter CbiQ, permease subunit [Candidatus Omnitrophus magneticus]|uniref:Cobalt ABC transporter CbiQ, permease subunit n=1 Tax=Candidatus Omnitrophus magneticus TaxID=1609969 RepID=A0A0F0CV29_9BACT|nr:Cobalt ABC transporter CbiQ, permease subunit [Candidatus Omnitrophus magneticus]KJJ85396.1 Cobalt ABC transporter CbiQ, permease subunit [Candidatus Omnitrophus magneticus]